jgi:hypothetical protein
LAMPMAALTRSLVSSENAMLSAEGVPEWEEWR